MAPPITFTQAQKDEVLRDLALGIPLAEICRREGMPCRQYVSKLGSEETEFGEAYRAARLAGFDAIAESVIEIIDADPAMIATECGLKIDPSDVANRKLRAEYRLKLLAKWDRKRYGEHMTHAGDPENPLVSASDDQISARIAELLAKGNG